MPSALVTGTSSGIGLATALELARAGYETWATLRNPAKADQVRGAADAEHLDLRIEVLDVTDPVQGVETLRRIDEAAGGLDVLVNNAGLAGATPLELVPEPDHRAMFEANYFGPIRLIQTLLPGMRERGSGTIVNMSSVTGRIAFPNQIPYSASKWALECASEALAHELRRFGIRVRIIEPGVILTSIFENAAPYTVFDRSSPYVDLMRRNGKFYAAGFRLGQRPELVARVVREAVESDSDQLRFVVGTDARSMIAGRGAMTDEEWVAMGDAIDDETYARLVREHFGIELP